MDPDKRSAWLQKLDAECPYQVVLPRRQLTDDSEIVNFLLSYAGKFDMYVEDECAAYVRSLKIPWTLRFSDRDSNGKAIRLGSRARCRLPRPWYVAHCRPIDGWSHGLVDKIRPTN
jgi:hypothetical protein